jgi:23S rRNA (cytidine1920-2'-O)/16S rRNA (cytidine1409-2'-O)-methyltransferase
MAGQARRRLDAELVRRRLARSREQAVELIAAGRVSVGGQRAAKAATQVETSAAIVVAAAAEGEPEYASRGGHKLAGALAAFGAGPDGLRVRGRRALDAGASTGGFTDVLLRAGARQVVAVDVGYGQLVWELRNDPRVVVVDRTNVRELTLDQIGGEPAELVVGDLSFISLTLVLPALVRCALPDADFALMVKPQFEVGRERLGAGGVVRDPALHAEAVRTVAAAAQALGLGVRGVTASPLPGPSGNVEYFLWLRRGAAALREQDVARAVAEGPAGRGSAGAEQDETGEPGAEQEPGMTDGGTRGAQTPGG